MSSNTTSAVQGLEGASLSQFLTTLITSGVIAAIEITIFILIRRKFKRIYEPKTYLGEETKRVKPLPNSLFGWLPALLKMPQEDLIRTSGLDAYFFARYLYIHAIFFLSSFILLSIILFPIYAVDGKGETDGKKGLDIITFGNISPSNSSRYAAPLVLAYAFISGFLYILYLEMKNFVEKRQSFLRSPSYQSNPSSSTILVTTIPKIYMSQDVLLRIFNQFPGGVKYIWLNRNLDNLPDKVDERTKFVEKLETAECKMIKNALKKEMKRQKKNNSKVDPVENIVERYIQEKDRPKMRIGSIPLFSSICFGKKVDTITYYKETISQLNTEIERIKTRLDNSKVHNSAFIEFNQQISAHMAIQCVTSSIPLSMIPSYIDVKPENIVWKNLKLTFYEKKVRQLVMLAATAVLIIFWAIPVAFVGILSNVTYLTNTLTFLQFINNLPSFLLGLITGLLPSILLSVLMALLPIVLTFIAKQSGIATTDAIDRYVQGSYFIFQVVHAFLFVTISSSVTSVITTIIQNPSSAATILAANIPTASNFFFSFLALQGLSQAASLLLQIFTFILFYLLGKLFDNTPRKKWKRYFTLDSLTWGTIFPIFTNFVVITLVYSIIAPLILIISGLAFVLFYIAYIYTMFYVSDFPNDSGGLAFSRAIYQSFTGIYLMEILLAALFFLAQNQFGSQSAIPEGIFMCIAIACTIAIQFLIISSFDPLTYYLPVDVTEFQHLNNSIDEEIISTNPTINDVQHITNTNETNIDFHEYNMDNTFVHPAIKDPNPIIWIPKDSLGIAESELQRTRASGLNVLMSTEGAKFNEKINIQIDGSPPDHL
jgi:hypothetical protein